jgi:prolyl-tRNA synthetase
LIKTIIFETDKGPVAALVRGDHEINETKLRRLLEVTELTLAGDEAVAQVTAAPKGFAGPVGLTIKIIADFALKDARNSVVGANELDTHLINVNVGRDFKPEFADIRLAQEGDPCPRCAGQLKISRGIEVGHIFKLGTKYSQAFGATYLDPAGKEQLLVMGCYGIGVGRTAAAAIEQNHDEQGICFPMPLAPFQVLILPVNNKDEQVMQVAEDLYRRLAQEGAEVLIDDRDERPGVKFKDADMIGIPLRVTVGEKNVSQGKVEIKERSSGKVTLVAIEEAAAQCLALIAVGQTTSGDR